MKNSTFNFSQITLFVIMYLVTLKRFRVAENRAQTSVLYSLYRSKTKNVFFL